MKRLISIALCFALTGCAAMKRHPVITAAVVTIPTVIVVAHFTTHNCPSVINGYPYSGTPPCPNPATYDPGKKR